MIRTAIPGTVPAYFLNVKVGVDNGGQARGKGVQTSHQLQPTGYKQPYTILYNTIQYKAKAYRPATSFSLQDTSSLRAGQSWARGNCLASRQRQRDNVMELQRQEKIMPGCLNGVATTSINIMP